MKTRKNYFRLGLITFLLVLAIAVRLYKIDNSITEWFSWRQSDTAAVGRFLQRHNFNLFKPQYYDLSNIQSSLDNPQGLRFVEFPLYNAIFAALAQAIPIFSLEVWARLVSIAFSLLVMVALFLILEAEFGLVEAFFAALFFAINPYVVFYSRAILPDMPATALAVLGVFFAYRYLKRGWPNLVMASLVFAAALLVKPTVIFFVLPAVYLLFKKTQPWQRQIMGSLFFLIVAIVPLILWRTYIQQFPEGVPYNAWLITSVNTSNGLQSVWFRPSFFRWIFFERINNLLLGGYLVFFMLFGLLIETKKSLRLSWWFLGASLLYLFTFQGGNVQHEYYQVLITPTLALLIGIGVGGYLRQKKSGYLILRIMLVLIIFGLSWFFSFFKVRGNYDEQPHLILIADVVRSLTNRDDIIVTDSMGDTTLLYLADRRGYPAPYRDFPALIAQGARYFVTQNLDYKQKLTGTYSLVFENDQVLIFKL